MKRNRFPQSNGCTALVSAYMYPSAAAVQEWLISDSSAVSYLALVWTVEARYRAMAHDDGPSMGPVEFYACTYALESLADRLGLYTPYLWEYYRATTDDSDYAPPEWKAKPRDCMLRELCDRGEHDTARIARAVAVRDGKAEFPPPPSDRPHWSRDTGILWFRSQRAKQVKNISQAHFIEILDTFETQGWPPFIEWPYVEPENPKRPGDLVYSLNQNLEGIVFQLDGSGLGRIKWQPQSPDGAP